MISSICRKNSTAKLSLLHSQVPSSTAVFKFPHQIDDRPERQEAESGKPKHVDGGRDHVMYINVHCPSYFSNVLAYPHGCLLNSVCTLSNQINYTGLSVLGKALNCRSSVQDLPKTRWEDQQTMGQELMFENIFR